MFEATERLIGKRIAIVATNGFEEMELLEPQKILEHVGAKVDIISLEKGSIKAWKDGEWGKTIPVDLIFSEADPMHYDALMLPGGVINADRLRMEPSAVRFVSEMIRAGKPLAAICHAPWILIETGFTKNRTMTSWPSLKTDLRNAGCRWVDKEVVTEDGWITSRMPDDLPVFCEKMIEEFEKGRSASKAA